MPANFRKDLGITQLDSGGMNGFGRGIAHGLGGRFLGFVHVQLGNRLVEVRLRAHPGLAGNLRALQLGLGQFDLRLPVEDVRLGFLEIGLGLASPR